MLSLSLQRSPRNDRNLHPQSKSASRLFKSASVPKLTLEPPSPSPQLPPHNYLQASFVLRSGVKHHAFSPDVPYPLSYHRNILACDALDHATLRSLYKSSSTIDFTDRGPPNCCLDLGCGPGAWVMEAANEWPSCQFVGFDIVNLQIPSHRLSSKYSSRIRWVQGDFLKPLPFDNEYFDHVHIRQIARGVPEDKWDSVIAEVARVLKVGGSVEIFEEDIIFPVLPRSSTAMPRKGKSKRKASITPYPASGPRSAASITTQISPSYFPEHDHAILESLFYRVFERRFINLRPTALIMGTLNIHMRQAGGSPLINFPRPPAPLLDGHSAPKTESSGFSRSATPRMFDQGRCKTTSRSSTPIPEKCNLAEDEQISSTTSNSRRSTLYSERSTPATSVTEFENPTEGPIAFFSDADLTSVTAPDRRDTKVLSEESLEVTSGTMGLNLYRSWQGVMACREAMWDEYRMASEISDPLLDMLEWEENEIDLPTRVKFEILMERYQGDMEAHYPMANALVSDLHWKAPLRDTKQEDKSTKQAVAEARRDALILERSGIGLVPERSRLCRKARIFIGRKGAVFGVE